MISLGNFIHPYRNCRTAWHPKWSEAGELRLRNLGTRSTWATGRTTWLALAMPIDLGDWPNDSVHPGCLDRPGRLAEQPGSTSLLGALAGSIWLLCALLGGPTGSIWLPNECPIDTISKKKSMCNRTSCLDAACLARSASILHASNLVYIYIYIHIYTRDEA